ncbi:MAG TPA: 50S ribosomal protein L5 [Candidatus Paceibacterota bacterium]|nr:50S ribosomal protein L5 [Candidatus Paceibacterota bacterium]
MSRLIKKYRKEVIPAMQKEFGIKNVMAVPKVDKVVINVGIGKVLKDEKAVEKIVQDVTRLTGQKPVFRKAKRSIASFKIREGMNVGLSATLRGERMYDFIDRLVSIALPRSKDFRGIDTKNFDKNGNLNLGIKESSIFPEVTYETLKDIFSLEVTVATTARDQQKGIALLRSLGFPIRSDI